VYIHVYIIYICTDTRVVHMATTNDGDKEREREQKEKKSERK
jgi:hypothetical protein